MKQKLLSRLTLCAMAAALTMSLSAFAAAAEENEPQDTPQQQTQTDDPENPDNPDNPDEPDEPELTVGDVASLKYNSGKDTLSWSAAENAQGYIIYCKNGEELTELGRTDAETRKFAVSVAAGEKKTFAVKGYAIKEDETEAISENYAEVLAAKAPETVVTLTASDITSSSAKLSWKALSEYDGYIVYRYNASTGKWAELKKQKGTTLTVSGLAAGSENRYAVKGYMTAGDTELRSPNFKSVKVYTKLKKVSSIKLSARDTGSVTVKWPSLSGVSGYYLYRYDTAAKAWVRIKTLSSASNTYKVSGLSAATDYKFAVKAYKKLGTKIVTSESFPTVWIGTNPADVKSLTVTSAADTYAKLEWSKVSRATGYIVYRYDASAKQWVRAKKTTATSATIKNIDLKNGKQIKFAVRAYRSSKGGSEVKSIGKVTAKASTMYRLAATLKTMTDGYYGDWSVYVKNLKTGEYISLNNKPMYAASTIKLYAMAAAYERIGQGKFTESSVSRYLNAMITVSDNTSFNYLIQRVGLGYTNQWIQDHGYSDTRQVHGLNPSTNYSRALTTGTGSNMTSAEDCGKLLESIYKGKCVSKSASAKMLALLKAQKVRNKIPSGIPAGVTVANKTGEVDNQSHDTAIVFSPNGDFIITIFCTAPGGGWASAKHHGVLSRTVYNYFNS